MNRAWVLNQLRLKETLLHRSKRLWGPKAEWTSLSSVAHSFYYVSRPPLGPQGTALAHDWDLLASAQHVNQVWPGFPCGSAGKEFACNAGDLSSIPGLGRSPGEGKDYPLQYSDLENSMDCIVHGVAKSRTWLSDFIFKLNAISQFGGNYWWLNCGHSWRLYLDWVVTQGVTNMGRSAALGCQILLVPSRSTAWSHSLTQGGIQNSGGCYKQVVLKVFLPPSINQSQSLRGDLLFS